VTTIGLGQGPHKKVDQYSLTTIGSYTATTRPNGEATTTSQPAPAPSEANDHKSYGQVPDGLGRTAGGDAHTVPSLIFNIDKWPARKTIEDRVRTRTTRKRRSEFTDILTMFIRVFDYHFQRRSASINLTDIHSRIDHADLAERAGLREAPSSRLICFMDLPE